MIETIIGFVLTLVGFFFAAMFHHCKLKGDHDLARIVFLIWLACSLCAMYLFGAFS